MAHSPIPVVPSFMRLCLVAVFLFGSAILGISSYLLATGAGGIIGVYHALVLASLTVLILPTIAIFEHSFYKWSNGYIALVLAGLGATWFFVAAVLYSIATVEIYDLDRDTADPSEFELKILLLKVFALGVAIAGSCVVNWVLLTLYSVSYATALLKIHRSVSASDIEVDDRPQTPAQVAYYGSIKPRRSQNRHLPHQPLVVVDSNLTSRSLPLPLPAAAANYVLPSQYPIHPPATNEPRPNPTDHSHPLRSNPSQPSLRRESRNELETILEV